MTLIVINQINGKLKFLYRKNKFLTPKLRRTLCNALIQPHFDYACPAWYPNLTKKTKKIQIMQNKCICFCHRLNKMQHTEFRSIDWLPTKERVHKCINPITFRFVNNKFLFYLNEFSLHCRIDTRNGFARLKYLFPRLTQGRKPYHTLVSLCRTIYPNLLKE